jgi:VanZ family protein
LRQTLRMIRKNLFSILVALLLLFLSLTSSETFRKVHINSIPDFDKIVHFGMYFFLMSVIIIEHRKSLNNPLNLFVLALIPLSYGILMEILQLTLTSTRSGDLYDALADAAGVLASALLWLIFKSFSKNTVRSE